MNLEKIIGSEQGEIKVVKTSDKFKIVDTLEIQQDLYKHKSTSKDLRDFPAVTGEWSGYYIHTYNDNILAENSLYVSDSFDFADLNEPWQRPYDEDLDLHVDMDADRFRIGVPSKPEFGDDECSILKNSSDISQASSPINKMNIHPHYNKYGQVDAIILDYTGSYAAATGLYRYNILQLDIDDYFPKNNFHDKDGLYELIPRNLDWYRARDSDSRYLVEDTETGFIDMLRPDVKSEDFVNNYLFNSELYENKGTSYYLLPTEQKGDYILCEFHNIYEILKVAIYHQMANWYL